MTVRVLLVDDQALFREALAVLLGVHDDIEVAGEAADGAEALRQVAALRPDVVLMDLRMPVLDGIAATRRIRADHPGTRVIALTTFDDDDDVFAALRAGAVGYLLKDRVSEVAEFLDALDRVAGGGTVLDPEVVGQLLVRRRRDDPLRNLTPREREVLALMAEGRSNTAIARKIVVTEGAVEKHVRNIFTKLDLPPDDEQHRRVLAVLAYLRS
jgi:DNA-binding NarL/FixJ family response regulator